MDKLVRLLLIASKILHILTTINIFLLIMIYILYLFRFGILIYFHPHHYYHHKSYHYYIKTNNNS
jgi:hypothetical protein